MVEQLDTETGTTIARLGRPLELYRETYLQDPSGRFAFFGPFETNQMGKRESFLWIAVPMEPVAESVPVIEVNGAPLSLGTPGRAADFAGIHKSPYKIPTPWSAMYYFRVDSDLVARLGEATKVTIRVLETAKSGDINSVFALDVGADARLKDFAAR